MANHPSKQHTLDLEVIIHPGGRATDLTIIKWEIPLGMPAGNVRWLWLEIAFPRRVLPAMLNHLDYLRALVVGGIFLLVHPLYPSGHDLVSKRWGPPENVRVRIRRSDVVWLRKLLTTWSADGHQRWRLDSQQKLSRGVHIMIHLASGDLARFAPGRRGRAADPVAPYLTSALVTCRELLLRSTPTDQTAVRQICEEDRAVLNAIRRRGLLSLGAQQQALVVALVARSFRGVRSAVLDKLLADDPAAVSRRYLRTDRRAEVVHALREARDTPKLWDAVMRSARSRFLGDPGAFARELNLL